MTFSVGVGVHETQMYQNCIIIYIRIFHTVYSYLRDKQKNETVNYFTLENTLEIQLKTKE